MIRHFFATPSNPVRLVKPEDDPADQAAPTETAQIEPSTSPEVAAAIEVATNWWIMTPLILVGTAAILTIQLRISRSRRLPPEERAFRALAKAMRLPGEQRLMTKHLAEAHPTASPVALLLSDKALEEAASLIEIKPGSSGERVLRSLLGGRGLKLPKRGKRAVKPKQAPPAPKAAPKAPGKTPGKAAGKTPGTTPKRHVPPIGGTRLSRTSA